MEKQGSAERLSIVHGMPLDQEEGVGATTMPAYLREVSSRFATREALVMYSAAGAERWTYKDLWERSLQLARALVKAGVTKDSRVGILMTNRPEFISSLFATAMAGGVAVVFSTFSTAHELAQLLRLSSVSILLFEGCILKKNFATMLAELEPRIRDARPGELQSDSFPFLQRLVQLESLATDGDQQHDSAEHSNAIESWRVFLQAGSTVDDALIEQRCATLSPADNGGIFFSSGTTSLPKGILHTQRAFALQWWRYPRLTGVTSAERVWTGNGFFWSANITMTIGLALSNGGSMVLQPWFEPEATLELIEKERITYMSGRPHQWARLLEAPNWQSSDLSSLRYVTRGELIWTHPTVNTDWIIPMGYGNTETMSICSSNAYLAKSPPADSFGLPLPGTVLKIVDPDTEQLVPRGHRGEIFIKGPTLMRGYLGKTVEQCFDEEGYFATGDGGYVDEDGVLFWEGRLTEIIKTGGANVSPIEIDEALALYPGVRRAQTVGLPHSTLGEIVVSCVVANDGVRLDESSMLAYLKERLASYKLPKKVLFFRHEELELTGSGKVKLAQLRQLASKRLAEYSSRSA